MPKKAKKVVLLEKYDEVANSMDTESTIPSSKEIPDSRTIMHRDDLEHALDVPAEEVEENSIELTPILLASVHHVLDE